MPIDRLARESSAGEGDTSCEATLLYWQKPSVATWTSVQLPRSKLFAQVQGETELPSEKNAVQQSGMNEGSAEDVHDLVRVPSSDLSDRI
eukprot:3803197-Karenia_brevis.AAC.1